MKFLTEEVRKEFYFLPPSKQIEFKELDESLAKKNQELVITMVEIVNREVSEISVRVDSKFGA